MSHLLPKMTADLAMESHKITGLTPGAAAGEAATFEQLPRAFLAEGAATVPYNLTNLPMAFGRGGYAPGATLSSHMMSGSVAHQAGTIHNFRLFGLMSVASAEKTITVELFKNGTATGKTLVLTVGSATVIATASSDPALAVSAGDIISMAVVSHTITVPNTAYIMGSFTF